MRNLTDLESRRHGDPLFPFARYHMAVDSGKNALDAHWHGELEFMMMTRGRAVFQLDGVDVALRRGDGLFIGGGVLHGGDRVPGCPCVYDAAVFNPALISGNRTDLADLRVINPVLSALDGKVLALDREGCSGEQQVLDRMEELTALGEGIYYELEVKRVLLAAMADVHRLLFEEGKPLLIPAVSNRKAPSVKEVLRYLGAHYADPVTLDELAGISGMSPSQFSRRFKATVRMTPIEYLHSLRINAAVVLLRETDRPLFHIAQDVGYESVNYFIRRFKRIMGIPPGQYRRSRE